MDENEEQLTSLGVNLQSQSALEQEIENTATSLYRGQLIEQEQKRLERAQNALGKIEKKKSLLLRKLNNASRISVKQTLREKISELDEHELLDANTDVKEIKERLKELINEKRARINKVSSERRENESEHDYLVRIGKITAFGTKNEFKLETRDFDQRSLSLNTLPNENSDYQAASLQILNNTNDDQDEDYENDSNVSAKSLNEDVSDEETGIKLKVSETRDDGDELYFNTRLRKWIAERSKNRVIDHNPELPEWRKPHPQVVDAKLNEEFKIPGDIFPLLFNYQKTCVQWLYELRQQKCGGIIGDEMGLGKTIQIIAFLASLHHSGLLNGPVLIVCPATVMKQWCNELHHWWPPFRSIILHSMSAGFNDHETLQEEELENMMFNSDSQTISYDQYKNPGKIKQKLSRESKIQKMIDKVVEHGNIIITTYVGLQIHSDKLKKVNWSYAILDEGHKIRNPNSDISLTCKKLKTRNRIILSGTPIQNNLNELWSLFDFIYPGKLGTLPVFQQQFVMPINAGGYANATNVQVQTGYNCAVALKNLIAPYLLRRVKSDVAKDLPKKKEMVLFCKLTQYQRSKYLEFLNSTELDQIQKGKRKVLYGIDILRKICNHPDLLEREERRHDKSYGNPKRSGKMQIVKQLLLLWKSKGHKTLLFTQSRQMLDILEEFISFKDSELDDIRFLRMDGNTNISARQNLVDRFNNESYDVFLLTTKVGGLGINLTGANRIIIFDPDWNPSTDMQARERAWRIGQRREVSIYRLIVTGTIEEKIYHRQIFKQFLTNKILSDPKQKRFFKMSELHNLFTLGGEQGHATEELEEEVQKHTQNLLDTKTAESDDFDQMLKLTGISKLESFYNGKEQLEKKKNEDDRLMEGLLGEGSLISAEAHDNVINSHTEKSLETVQKEAKKAANEALLAIKKSRKNITDKYEIGTPTWTGKFGKAGKIAKSKKNFGLKVKKEASGSAKILENIKKSRLSAADEQLKKDEAEDSSSDFDQERLLALERCLKDCPNHFSTSTNIVNKIGITLEDKNDVIKFRALLKSIATFDSDRKGWVLNEETFQ